MSPHASARAPRADDARDVSSDAQSDSDGEVPEYTRLREHLLTSTVASSTTQKLTHFGAVRDIIALGAPISLQYLSSAACITFQLALVARHAGADALAAFGLANVLTSVSGHVALWGLGAGVDTASSQAYGAKNLDVVGATAVRAFAVLVVLACAPGAVIWNNAEGILSRLGQTPTTSAMAGQFARIRSPGLFAQAATCVCLKTMMAMKKSARVGTLSVITSFMKFAAPWLFIQALDLGFEGAAMSLVVIDFSTMVCYVSAMFLDAECRRAFKHVEFRDAFRGWKSFLALALPALALNFVEWVAWDVMAFLAGMCANATLELDAMTLVQNAYFWFYSLACVWQRGASSAVGNAVGAGRARDAAMLARATLTFALCVAVLSACGFYALADRVFGAETSDQNVVARLDALVPLVTAYIILDNVQVALCGVVVGAGYQSSMTPALVVAYWLVGIPLAAHLALGPRKMGLVGIWIGLLSSAWIHLAWSMVVCFGGRAASFTIDWPVACERALDRIDADAAAGANADDDEKEDEEDEEDVDGKKPKR